MYQFKRSMISVALASALSAGAFANPLLNADVPAESEQVAEERSVKDKKKAKEEVVRVEVTGIRAGIERSIDAKRESSEIVEAISAEDIGKLPDVSIAESIARLPGLTAQRVAGRASTIQIRGLADDFGTALLNGREQVSVGHNRGVEFDQYPSELMSQVVVYKTPNASLVGQGLSGTVNLKTVQPLSYDRKVFAANFRIEENSNGSVNPDTDDRGSRFNFSYIDQLADGKVGVAIGFAHIDTPSQANRWDSWGYAQQNLGGEDVYVLGGTKAQASSAENTRDGLMAVVEFRPNDKWRSTIDGYYSKFDTKETLRFIEAGTVWISPCWWNCSPTTYTTEGPSVVSGRFVGVNPVVRNDINESEDELKAFGWKNEFEFSDSLSGMVDISFSEAERDSSILETYAGRSAAVFLGWDQPAPYMFPTTDTLDFAINRNGFTQMSLGANYADPSSLYLADPMGWGQDGYIKYPKVSDELQSYRGSLTYTFSSGFIESVEFGINFSEREKSRSVEEFKLELSADEVAISPADVVGTVNLGFAGAPTILALDVDSILANYTFVPNVHYDIYRKSWMVNEKVTTAYAQFNLDMFNSFITGNAGIQYVRTDQSSVGTDPARATPVTGGETYDHILPSLNLNFAVADEQVVRLGLGRQLARGRMDDMRASQDVGIATTGQYAGLFVGGGGNPTLQPWEANAADLSYEFYFGEKGYIALAGYYKDLRNYIYNDTIPYDFSGIDTSSYNPAQLPQTFQGYLTGPTNGKGGTISGWELSLSLPFDLLTDALEGFGIQASYSDTDSDIKPNGPTGASEPLPGLSDVVSNLTVYYENYGFQARVSQRHRSDFLGEVQGFGGDRNKVYIEGEDIVDLQLGYSFAEASALNGLTVLFQVNNLNDEGYSQYFADRDNLPQFYAEYGRTVLLGASYKF